jgi:hypothetical protein
MSGWISILIACLFLLFKNTFKKIWIFFIFFFTLNKYFFDVFVLFWYSDIKKIFLKKILSQYNFLKKYLNIFLILFFLGYRVRSVAKPKTIGYGYKRWTQQHWVFLSRGLNAIGLCCRQDPTLFIGFSWAAKPFAYRPYCR